MVQGTFDAYTHGQKFKESMHLQGVHTYDLLKNPIYVSAF